MKITLKKIINAFGLPRFYYHNWQHRRKVSGKPVEAVFTEIAVTNFWGDNESVSGAGSNLEQTQVIVNEIPRLLKKYDIKSMLDLPCGDFNWMRHVDLTGINYIGGDIVESLVTENQKKYSNANRRFEKLNLLTDKLPQVDMVFCRDCFVHLSNEQVQQGIDNIRNNNIRYLLTTSHNARTKNKNILAGEWRPLNLEIAPFNFTPVDHIFEHCTEDDGRKGDKYLVLLDLKKASQPS